MALVEGCRHSLELTIPVAEVEAETTRAVADVQKRAKVPGFRPGKVPSSLIRRQFAGDIRQRVLEALIPTALQTRFREENLEVLGTPDITDVHFHDNEPLRFTAVFEVMPAIELGEYKSIEVPYQDPEITEEDVTRRIDELRDQKAEYVNLDPRPVENGDHVVVALESLGGGADAVKQDEMVLHVGAADTLPAFSENLLGMSPGDEKEFEVAYPEDFGTEKLAGTTVRFKALVKGIRRKELPEVNDDFAQGLGDFRTVDELREAIRKAIFGQRQHDAQLEAKNKVVDKIVDAHDFPVPEIFIERQARNRVEQTVRTLASQGVDPGKLKLDWTALKDSQREKAVREVKASLLLERIAAREAIGASRDEVDREVERIARQQREVVAAVQMRFEKDGTLGRIASHIQTEKTLNFLFENARKTADA